jgi:hypothetical protein
MTFMKYVKLPVPELLVIAASRAMLGAGIALLLGDHLDHGTRRVLGITLTAVGLLSTAPLAYDVLHCRLSE